jgi:hypothetical protein
LRFGRSFPNPNTIIFVLFTFTSNCHNIHQKHLIVLEDLQLIQQGENMHPFLFSIFLNDLEEFLLTKDIVGLKSITDELETELEIYLKIFAMLYADDTILLAEST